MFSLQERPGASLGRLLSCHILIRNLGGFRHSNVAARKRFIVPFLPNIAKFPKASVLTCILNTMKIFPTT